jgi:hypothetical protein
MVPVMRPATPPEPATSSAEPSVTLSNPPTLNATWLNATRSTVLGVASVVVAFSMAMSPEMTWFSTVTVMPVPTTRRYGPAARFSSMVLPAKVTDCDTSAAVVLTSMDRLPSTPASGPRFTWMSPAMVPARPAPETTSRPWPSARTTLCVPLPRVTPTLARPRIVTAAPWASVPRWTSTSAVSSWPATVSVRCSATTRRAVVAAARVSTSTETVVPETPSAETSMVALRAPYRPAPVRVSDPVMPVTATAWPRSTPASARVTVTSPAVRPKPIVPVRATPPKARVALDTANSVTVAVVAKSRATPVSVLPGIVSVVVIAAPVVFTRTLVVPASVSPATPTMLTVPDATRA